VPIKGLTVSERIAYFARRQHAATEHRRVKASAACCTNKMEHYFTIITRTVC